MIHHRKHRIIRDVQEKCEIYNKFKATTTHLHRPSPTSRTVRTNVKTAVGITVLPSVE